MMMSYISTPEHSFFSVSVCGQCGVAGIGRGRQAV